MRDYRAMISSLEQTKGEGPQLPPSAFEASPSPEAAGSSERTMAEPVIRSLRPAAPSPSRPAPLGFAELRSKLSALSDARHIMPSSRPAAASAAEATVNASTVSSDAAAVTQASRRRMFGAASRAESEPAARRRRAASGEAFTWRRLGVLAVCFVAVGGAAVALQSVVGRDEARVAPEVIGNAAIAAVAPSAPAAAVPAPEPARVVVAEPAAPSAPAALRALEAVQAPPAMPSISARTLLAPDPVEPGPAVPGLTAFAAPEPSVLAAAPEAKLPRQAPLPPPAPPRRAAVVAAVAPATAAAKPADEVADAADAAPSEAGAEPTGGATIRSPVTMRTGPNKGAAAMQTLKSGQQVELVACDSWCEIVADGKRGFIYKSFLNAGAPREADATPVAE
ncbi:SH3 domain-containing protein [Ancylobacter sp. 3268]|uniref:SH3 domain-containing protein n=1 Tax=Ancylobacter sp. 3268 TaxID=2817752 RepID=UPI00286A37D9|nr:SH3 domain-containing protein [Ancylobacter sp. 3268]